MQLIEAIRRGLACVAVAGLAACATAEPGAELSATDPYEEYNRGVLTANIQLDSAIMRPAAQAYDIVTPATIKHLVGNGFSHLDLPSDFINFVLQGKVKSALHVLGRFAINTVYGAGGLLDPATEFGLPERDTDFGITLGRHGVPEGTYWVLPLFGPTTTRDATGSVVDVLISPASPLDLIPPSARFEVGLGMRTLRAVDDRDRNKLTIDELLYESEDPYVSVRSAYLQHRRAQVTSDEEGAEALPDIFEQQ